MRSPSTRSRLLHTGAVALAVGCLATADPLGAQAIARRSAEAPAANHTGTEPGSRWVGVFAYDSAGNRMIVQGGNFNLRPPINGRSDVDPRTFAWSRGTWSIIATQGPRTRDEVAVATDSRDGSVLVFGGRGESEARDSLGRSIRVPFRETWRFTPSDARWTLVDTTGPSARGGAQAAFDARRGRVVLFGGRVQGAEGQARFPAETWEWDGQRWSRLDAPGPIGRNGHVLAYDARSGLVVLHGGVNGVALTDTWTWDGRAWQLRTMEGPRAIFGAAATDPDSGIVLFGGHTLGRGPATQTWHWTGREWNVIATDGPAPRTFNMMTLDPRHRQILMMGGSVEGPPTAERYPELWVFRADRTWLRIP